MVDDSGAFEDHAENPTAGEEIADQERFYWDNRRQIQELGDDESDRREGRQLRMRERKAHLRFRMHRYTRQQDQGPLQRDMPLPPVGNSTNRRDIDFSGTEDWPDDRG